MTIKKIISGGQTGVKKKFKRGDPVLCWNNDREKVVALIGKFYGYDQMTDAPHFPFLVQIEKALFVPGKCLVVKMIKSFRHCEHETDGEE
jgi:hypothetical protein